MQSESFGPDLVALLKAEENLQRDGSKARARVRVRPSSLIKDRHNIPETGTAKVKGPQPTIVVEFVSRDAPLSTVPPLDLPPRSNSSVTQCDSSVQALAYSPPPLPLPPAHLSETRDESTPVIADASARHGSPSVELAGEDDSEDILDLDNDPLYQGIQAQVGGATPNGSPLALFCITTNNLSYKLHGLCFSVFCKREGTPGDSPHLQRAFICGWRMLAATIFPLVPSHTIRCLWTLLQLVLFTIVFSVSFGGFTDSRFRFQSRSELVQLIFASIAFGAALSDLVVNLYMFLKCRTPDREAQPLLGRHPQSGRFLSWVSSKYNDVVRVLITELITYVILICSFPSTENSTVWEGSASTLKIAMLVWSGIVLFVCVYLAHFVILLRLLNHVRHQQFLQSPTRRKSILLFILLLLFLIGQRIIQVVLLVTMYLDCIQLQKWWLLGLFIVTYLLPAFSVLEFLALDYGWIEDLCIAFCGDYLGWLEHVSSTPQASQALKREIAGILQYFDHQNLRNDLEQFVHEYYFLRNFLYPFQSPLVIFYCIPYWFLVAIYLTVVFNNDIPWCIFWALESNLGLLVITVVPILLFLVNFHFFLYSLYLIFLALFCPCFVVQLIIKG